MIISLRFPTAAQPFTWPGWDEPGIVLKPQHVNEGRRAASRNLELAQKLGRGPAPFASAHWLVGAHELAAKNSDLARASFVRAVEHAKESGDERVVALMSAYVALADALGRDAKAQGELMRAQEEFRQQAAEDKDAQMRADQLASAWRVFSQ